MQHTPQSQSLVAAVLVLFLASGCSSTPAAPPSPPPTVVPPIAAAVLTQQPTPKVPPQVSPTPSQIPTAPPTRTPTTQPSPTWSPIPTFPLPGIPITPPTGTAPVEGVYQSVALVLSRDAPMPQVSFRVAGMQVTDFKLAFWEDGYGTTLCTATNDGSVPIQSDWSFTTQGYLSGDQGIVVKGKFEYRVGVPTRATVEWSMQSCGDAKPGGPWAGNTLLFPR